MKSTILNLRWRGMVAWALLAVGGGGPVGAFLLGLAQGERAQGETPAPTAAAQGRPRPTRPADDTVVVSARVLRSLGVHTTRVTEARRPRGLPSLTGTLALDTNRLARARARFAGEVVQLGTVAESDPTKPPRGTGGRLLHFGDTVRKNQLLAVVWSKDLGEKKSELVDAVSKLKLDREVLDRLRALFKEGGTSERNVREAERAVESDLIALARAERTLRSWRLTDAEIAAIRAEAEKLGRQGTRAPLTLPSPPSDGGEGRVRGGEAGESWARVEVRSPQDGVILEKNVSVGDLVDTSADLFKIADLSKLAFWAHAYEEDLLVLRSLPRGATWTIRLPAWPGETFKGELDRVGAVIDPNQHTALVCGLVDNAAGRLHVGQFVTAEVQLLSAPGEVEVPTAALVEDGHTSIVFVRPNPAKPLFVRRRIQVIRRFQDIVYLRAGTVRPGEHIVDSAAVLLNEAIEDLPVTGKKHE